MPDPPTRRQALTALGAVATTGLTGCNALFNGQNEGGSGTPTMAFPSSCEAELDSVASHFNSRLFPVRSGEYDGRSLVFTSISVPTALAYRSAHLFIPYLQPAQLHAERLLLPLGQVTRVTTLRPPDEITYHAYLDYQTTFNRTLFVAKLKTHAKNGGGYFLQELSGYDEYTVFQVNNPDVNFIAFNDERIIVAPSEDHSSMNLSGQKRFDRLLALQQGTLSPYQCSNETLRHLLRRVPMGDLVRARYRPHGETYPADHLHSPEGASAVAFTATVDESSPTTGTEPGTSSATTGTQSTATAGTVASSASGTTPANGTPSGDIPVTLRFAAAFPPRSVDGVVEAVRNHVQERRSHDQGLSFENPAYDRAGVVGVATETRPMTEMVRPGE